MEITFPASDESLAKATSFVEEQLEKIGCIPKVQMKILVALEELFVNVAHYAYNGASGEVRMNLDFSDENMILSLIDRGIPFNPLEKEDPDITESAEEREIGGLGIFMVKKMMDRIDYEYRDGQNIITITQKVK